MLRALTVLLLVSLSACRTPDYVETGFSYLDHPFWDSVAVSNTLAGSVTIGWELNARKVEFEPAQFAALLQVVRSQQALVPRGISPIELGEMSAPGELAELRARSSATSSCWRCARRTAHRTRMTRGTPAGADVRSQTRVGAVSRGARRRGRENPRGSSELNGALGRPK